MSTFKEKLLSQLVEDGWKSVLKKEFSQPYFNTMCAELETEYANHEIFPPLNHVFEAFNATPYHNVKVVLIGQDPYHDNNQAHGLCFSVLPGIKTPPSLVNMYKELETDIKNFSRPDHGYLIEWAQQGVFMLNATLTVRAHQANSHKKIGWQKFTDNVISILNDQKKDIVFALWGGFAQIKGKKIDEEKHHVLKCGHPSPLSVKSWTGCKVFSKINKQLSEISLGEINWHLSTSAPAVVEFVDPSSAVISKKKNNNNGGNGAKGGKRKKDILDEQEDSNDYHSMTVKDLKEACRGKGLPVSGSKGDLLLRLSSLSVKVSKSEEDEEINSEKDEEEEEEEEEDGEEEIDYGNMTIPQLKELLKEKGLFTSGNKSQLIERLESNSNGKSKNGKKETAVKATAKKSATKKGRKGDDDEGEGEGESESQGNGDIIAIVDDDSSWPTPLNAGEIKIVTWNVAGWGSVIKKGFSEYVKKENPDIICLQETKISPKEVAKNYIPGYHQYFSIGEKKGYSGVAAFTKKEPISITEGIGSEKFDIEGRTQNLEFENFYLVNTYVPNASRDLKRLDYRMEWDEQFKKHIQSLNEKKPVIWCGDLNVAHQPIDLKNPKTNSKTAGFTPEERANFTTLLGLGYVDVWRHLNPAVQQFTYWSYFHNARAKNAGWRLDYFILSQRFLAKIKTSFTRPTVLGSDHCPLGIVLEDTKAE